MHDPKPMVLIAEDDEAFANQLSEILTSERYDVVVAHDGSDALKILQNNHIDLGFIDLSMPGIDGIQVLEKAQTIAPEVPLIMITGYASIDRAVKAIKLGAYDFIEKPVSLDRLLISAKHAFEKRELQLRNRWMAEEIMSHYQMVGTSKSMQQIYHLIDKIAPTQSTVLITGETGTGKELVARALHIRSLRSKGPFVHVNCAAIPDTLLESELFGFRKGAFTNATYDKRGKIEIAANGTLFLDEIGDLSLSSQAKVLHALEHHEIMPIGETRSRKINVRVLAATNKNLLEEIANEAFREDLFYRLNTVEIELPPLQERKEDIPELAAHFLDQFSKQHNRYFKGFMKKAIHFFLNQEWPGNVRQLRSVIERLVLLSNSEEITVDDVAYILKTQQLGRITSPSSFKEAEEAFQKEFFVNALIAHNWNVTEAAKTLKIDRTNLYKKMQRLGIPRTKRE